jgi:2-keto-4-pentenoate hydratase/2-oxohepta-3-ene-1,7-dioic acid hydratase in catechol pathway
MKELMIPGIDLPVRTIYCIGRNYTEHAIELNNPIPTSPLVFLKPQSTICFDGSEISIPAQTKDVHHEVEVVLAISKESKNVKPENALDHVSGIGIGIDFTARDIQQKAKQAGHPWTIAKGFDNFAPISTFVPIQEIKDVDNLDLQLSVNGVKRQSGNTSQMIFPIAQLISYLSEVFTLAPGDLVFTGTPSGVSAVKSGDKIFAELDNNLTSLSISIK